MGDSAFGFSGFEFETSTRYNLPLVIIIINNNGIFMGVDELSQKNNEKPVTALNPNSRYEKLVYFMYILSVNHLEAKAF